MLKTRFNEGWIVTKGVGKNLHEMMKGVQKEGEVVTLPHDAMIYEKRSKDTKNGSQTGFYPGGGYRYEKSFFVPKDWEEKHIELECEGAYMNARVYINGDFAGAYPHGYSNFYMNLDDFLRYGETNKVEISVNNTAELNSRWYSGSGLYRNVNLLVGGSVHIMTDGVQITTPEIDEKIAITEVATHLKNTTHKQKQLIIQTTLCDAAGKHIVKDTKHLTLYKQQDVIQVQRIPVVTPQLWSCETPYLYTCTVEVMEGDEVLDCVVTTFGIRKLQLDPHYGLRINGETVKLRGACIHHDNGVIGACTLERAEERRCQQLKEAGFNCIRSSHHPISKAMLDACDRHGMLVMDELSDMWTQPKNHNDYTNSFHDYWQKDVALLVAKDFNHPSVILYSTGNEIPEAGTAKGAVLNQQIASLFKALDPTRYTTSAINGMMAAMDVMPAILKDIIGEEALLAMKDGKKGDDNKNEGGSDALNGMMAMMVGPLADAFAAHPLMTAKIDAFADGMDIAGYNYMTGRHAAEKTINPNRIVLGAETFPADIVRLWDIVENNSHVIGDMTWTGYDYLGEAGIGIFYYDGKTNFSSHWPDRVAYIGDIDLIGYRRPISYLREIVYGLRKAPYMAVERLNHVGEKPNKTPWMWKDNIASWTWPGYEGTMASVDVYADCDKVVLMLNGQVVGSQEASKESPYVMTFEVPYAAGELKAVAYKGDEEVGVYTLVTADDQVALDVSIDREVIHADQADLAYITVGLKDAKGNVNLHATKKVNIEVEGVGTLQGFGSADPQAEGDYTDTEWTTYDGYVLAVIRAQDQEGDIQVTLRAEGCQPVVKTIRVVKA